MLYQLVLFGHSYVRWIVLVLGLLVCVRAFFGWLGGRPWNPLDERLHVGLMAAVDTQFLLGLLLYLWLSPLSRTFLWNMSNAMKEPILRFYGLEHAVGMLIALALFHIGRTRSQRAGNGKLRHRRVWTFTLAALLITGASIPWPETPYGRPLFRGFAISTYVSSSLVPESGAF